jgi:RimJ/RimL family protein N-acetyltransferase
VTTPPPVPPPGGDQPVLPGARLLLRPFVLADAPRVRLLAGERDVASTTINIPHPYEDGMAEAWIGTHRLGFERGELAVFAVEERERGDVVGAMSLTISRAHERAELGYWIGVPYWGNGFATEAARELLRYGFEQLGLNRIYATHFSTNPASGRVLQKLGMRHEGVRRQHIRKWGEYLDSEIYGLLRSEWADSL